VTPPSKGPGPGSRCPGPNRVQADPVTASVRGGGRPEGRPHQFCHEFRLLLPRPLRAWSWRESNPRPLSGHRSRYDHSRVSGSTAAGLPGQLELGPTAGSFPGCQRSLPAVSGLSHRPPPLLLPGCGEPAPRAIAGRDVSLSYLTDQAARANSASVSALVWLPRLRSLSNSGRTSRLPVPTSKPISPVMCALLCQGTTTRRWVTQRTASAGGFLHQFHLPDRHRFSRRGPARHRNREAQTAHRRPTVTSFVGGGGQSSVVRRARLMARAASRSASRSARA
jgi:hypothetical protein